MAKQALEGSRLNAFSMDPREVVIIGLDTEDGPEHPLYDKRIKLPVSEALVQSMLLDGQIQPIKVRKEPSGRVVVLVGRQRTRAIRRAREIQVENGVAPEMLIRLVVMVDKVDDVAAVRRIISENEIRVEDTPLVKADKAQRALAMGNSEREAAIAFGVTVQTLKSWLKLIEADPAVRKAVDTGAVSMRAASKIVALPREEQRAALDGLVAEAGGKRVTGGAAERKTRPKPAEPDVPDPISAANKTMSEHLRAVVESYAAIHDFECEDTDEDRTTLTDLEDRHYEAILNAAGFLGIEIGGDHARDTRAAERRARETT